MTKKKPHIVCHMASTINGKILSANWGTEAKKYSSLYQQCPNTPTTFETASPVASHLHISEVKQLEHEVLWLKYVVKK